MNYSLNVAPHRRSYRGIYICIYIYLHRDIDLGEYSIRVTKGDTTSLAYMAPILKALAGNLSFEHLILGCIRSKL